MMIGVGRMNIKEIFSFIQSILSFLCAFFLGQERTKRKAVEKNLELREKYEEIDNKNKTYHDRGKSGLLDRLRKRSSNSG